MKLTIPSNLRRPSLLALLSVLVFSASAMAGTLSPSASPAATMRTLAEIYNAIAGTFDSSGTTANEDGSLIEILKYMENQVLWASGSNNVWNLNSGNVGINDSTPTTTLDVAGSASVSGSFEVGTNLYRFTSLGASFSLPFETTSYASISRVFGAGLTDCDAGATSKILWDGATGYFSCGSDQTGGGSSFAGLDFGTIGGSEIKISSISFDANQFDLSSTASSALVRLDWTNGPASRSTANTWSALNVFGAGASVSNSLELSGTGSISSSLTVGNGLSGSLKGLVVSNGTSTGNIFEARDNSSAVFTVADGGAVTATGVLNAPSIYIATNNFLGFAANGGGGGDTLMGQVGALTPDAPAFMTGTTANSYHILERSDSGFDFNNGSAGTSAQTDPTLIIHSRNQSTSEYIQINHNGIDAMIDVGTGVLRLADSASVSGSLEVTGIASASLRYGSGLTACAGANALQWSGGVFSCAAVGGGSYLGLDFGTIGGSQVKISSISFDAGMFDLSNTASSALVRLDWTNGPASRAMNNAWTGTGSTSFAGSLNISKSLTATNSVTAGSLRITGVGSSSFLGSLDISKGLRVLDLTSTGRYIGQGTGSSSFAGSLNISKSLTATNSVTAGSLRITGVGSSSFLGSLNIAKSLTATNSVTAGSLVTSGLLTAVGQASLVNASVSGAFEVGSSNLLVKSGGNIGIGTPTISFALTLGNTADKTIGIEASNNVTAGKALTLLAGNTRDTGSAGSLTALGQTSRGWQAIAVAPDGDVYAAENGGDIYKRASGSGNFVALGQTSRAWREMTVAPDGDVYAVVYASGIYKQASGSGDFTLIHAGGLDWSGMAAAPNGDIYAAAKSNYIYVQTAGAGTFTSVGSTGEWIGLAAAPNGDIYTGTYFGDVYKRTGGTGSFTALSVGGYNFEGFAVTPNGDVYFIVRGGDLYKQTGGTGSFVAQGQTNRQWYGLAADNSGGLYATVSTGDIYLLAASAGTADLAGGNLILSSGKGKGTGASTISFYTGTTLSTGTTLQTLSEKMTLLGSGNLGIGTTTPSMLAHILSASDTDIFRLQDSDGTCDHNPESGAETVTCSSDERLKSEIVDASSSLAFLRDFRIREYTVRASGDRMTGVIAQELQLTHPELVSSSSTGFLTVQQPNPWILVKGLQELDTRITALQMGYASGSAGDAPIAFGQSWLEQLFARIVELFGDILGIDFGQGSVKADVLCAGSICINEQQLEQLLNNAGMTSAVLAPSPTPMPEATPTPEINLEPTPEASVEPAPEPTPTPTPEMTPEPAPTMSP